MLKFTAIVLVLVCTYNSFAQKSGASLVDTQTDGRYTLSEAGASYFAQLSLDCTNKPNPHYYYNVLRQPGDTQTPEDLWPAFYGCYDWHSAVHNHWALIKLLKTYPQIPEAAAIREKLNQSFTEDNINREFLYFQNNKEQYIFEFPYGQGWLLKVAEELQTWNDTDAQRWLENLAPLHKLCAAAAQVIWKDIKEVNLSGSHDAPSLNLSFALDYARAFGDEDLLKVVLKASKKFYGKMTKAPLRAEPFEYDFMSASLLVTDLMRKVYDQETYTKWLKNFAPGLTDATSVAKDLQIKKTDKHDGYESHWDGYHLNRIWCLNGMLQSLPAESLDATTKAIWVKSMNDMWDYAQESIGKGNYDIDHWLSSFSVFALIGYQD
ncbi:MAG: hypothetical protein RLZZ38_1996 [Bacteroidota bacterium]|jgi:hypothetical protein